MKVTSTHKNLNCFSAHGLGSYHLSLGLVGWHSPNSLRLLQGLKLKGSSYTLKVNALAPVSSLTVGSQWARPTHTCCAEFLY